MMKRVVELAAKKVPLDSGQYPAFTVLVFKDAQYYPQFARDHRVGK